jgi:anti-anti-sigma factor
MNAIEDSTEELGDRSVLSLSGAVDARTTEFVRRQVYAELQDAEGDLVVDLSEVTSIDLTALRMLAMATRQAHRRGQRLILRGCGPTVLRLLHLSRIARCVEVERAHAIL